MGVRYVNIFERIIAVHLRDVLLSKCVEPYTRHFHARIGFNDSS